MDSFSIQHPLSSLSCSNVAYNMQDYARILLKGADAKSFLHRLSTNAVLSSQKGDSCLNVLVNAKGRLLYVLHQVIIDDQEILLIAGPKQGKDLCTWFDQFLFVEDVSLEDISEKGSLVCVLGYTNAIINMEKWKCQISDTQIIMRSFDFTDENLEKIPSFLIYDRQGNAERLIEKLEPAAIWLDENWFETARIAAGICMYPNEINDAFNPLELSLHDALHWNKGCYIGQEVISRLYTYQKQSKQLCFVSINEKDFKDLQVGQNILSNRQAIGYLTSISPFYWSNHANALAIIKQKPDEEWLSLASLQTKTKEVQISLTKIIP